MSPHPKIGCWYSPLIDQGTSVGGTPLVIAAMHGFLRIVRIFLAKEPSSRKWTMALLLLYTLLEAAGSTGATRSW